MDTRQRIIYPSARQKKKLLELMVKHPELVSLKVSQGFNYRDSQKLWANIANECNSIPGAKKTWRQWKKTWQDMKSKRRKQSLSHGQIPTSVIMLSEAEREALGLKNVSSTTHQDTTHQDTTHQDSTEFVAMDDNVQDSFDIEVASRASLSEPESPPEQKVFARFQPKVNNIKSRKIDNSKHSNKCVFNCDMLAIQEQKKIQIKEDYYNFKQDYLRQKLILLKEQTEALKDIAKELAK